MSERPRRRAYKPRKYEIVNGIEQKSENKVEQNACYRRPKTAPAAVFEIAGIDRYGLCPAEADEREQHESDRIEMLGRVQGHSAAPFCRRVAAFIRDEGVREFVHGQNRRDGKKFC